MSDGGASTGFSRGFFGCFGVLGAIAAVAAAALVWLAVVARTHPIEHTYDASASGPARVAIAPPQPVLERMCKLSLPVAERIYAVKGHLRRNGAALVGSGNAAGTADCPALDRLGEVEVGLNLTCDDPTNINCYAVSEVFRVSTLSKVPARP